MGNEWIYYVVYIPSENKRIRGDYGIICKILVQIYKFLSQILNFHHFYSSYPVLLWQKFTL